MASYKKTTTSGDPYGAVEYSIDNLHFKDNHQCAHNFVRKGNQVTCPKCGTGYTDDPREPFPLKEFNDFFNDPKNQEYFKRNPS